MRTLHGGSRFYMKRKKSGIALHLGGTLLLLGLFLGAILVFAAGPSIGLEETETTTSITTMTRTLPTVTSVSLSTSRLTTTLPPVTSVSVETLTTTQTLPPVTLVSISTLSTTQEVTITTTPSPPATVTVSGTLHTRAIGSSPTGVGFVSQTSGVSYLGKISGADYTVNLPNQDSYSITINENLLLGTGSCSAGTLSLFLELGNESITSNWSC